jgi:hypothetical protein
MMKKIIILTTAFLAYKSIFADSLPYYGPKGVESEARCKGKTIKPIAAAALKEIDGGAMMDENCTTIFVFPPRLGHVALTGDPIIYGGITNNAFCSSYNTLQKRIVDINKTFENACPEDQISQNEAGKLICSDSNLTVLSNSRRNQLEIALDSYSEQLSEYQASKVPVARLGYIFSSKWQELVNAYSEANSEVFKVEKLKIKFATMAKAFPKFNNGSLDHFLFEVGALKPIVDNTTMPEFIQKLVGTNPIPMLADTYGAEAVLGATVACPIIKDLAIVSTGEKAKENNLSEFQSALNNVKSTTYTYFYPFETKSFTSVKIVPENLKPYFEELLKKIPPGTPTVDLSSEQILAARGLLKQAFIYSENVGFTEGNSCDNASEDKKSQCEEALDAVVTQIANAFLMAVSSQIRVEAKDTNNYTADGVGTGTKRVCTGGIKMFGPFECHNTTYTFPTKISNWNLIAEKISNYISNYGSVGATVQSNSRVMYSYGTAAYQ